MKQAEGVAAPAPFRVRGPRVLSLVTANVGVVAVFYAGLANLLPRKIEEIAGASDKVVVLGLVTAVSAVVAMLSNVAVGWASDRWRTPLGRRRPWIIAGSLVGAAGLVAVSVQETVPGIFVTWAVTQAGTNCALAALSAFIPDHVPARHMAEVSALVGLGQVIGIVLGAGSLVLTEDDTGGGFVLLAGLYFLLLLPSAISQSDGHAPAPVQAGPDRPAAPGRSYRDYWLAWSTRFIVTFSNAIAFLYLFYYLTDVLELPDATRRQGLLIGVAAVFLIFSTLLGGRLSDRSGRRKVFVVWAILLMTVAALLLGVLHTWNTTLLAAAVLGLGYGVYLSVDQALCVQTLPNPTTYARDLGIMNLANAAPQTAAPLAAAAILATPFGYSGLYIAAALISLLGIVFVFPIRGVR
ncbi:MFS transporter [Actinomadura craniellae]|uniref:MFS transporter n=1 Tax=Actinomadura craniellae TaxID=2231787 RepID=A0A365H0N5_9ACTN|nr:MFS transporter [Actinomadura craniellae]RAY12606.1 MFS transporter [Actinomadura craniellae]